MSRCSIIFALALLCIALAGCQSGSSSRKSAGNVHPIELPSSQSVSHPAPARPVTPLTNPPTAVTPAPVPPPVAQIPAVATNVWVKLESVVAKFPSGQITRLNHSTNAVYRLKSSHGTAMLTIGSRQATWNGTQFWLGYAPMVTNGVAMINALDVVKCLDPLALNERWHAGTKKVIVIDAGHGGVEVGTRSIVNNHFEKEYTLDWAFRLRRLLIARGWQVFMTRETDADVPRAERVAIADREKADLFISLHFNSAFPKQEPEGIETYCLTPIGMPSTLQRGSEDHQEVLSNNEFDDENLRLAFQVHQHLIAGTKTPDRGVRHARFMTVLRGQHRPAILIEGGYLSNPEEARHIATPEYRQKLALAVAEALSHQPADTQ